MTQRHEPVVLWLFAAAVALGLLFPGEVVVWTKWLLPMLCITVAAVASVRWLLAASRPAIPLPAAFMLLLIVSAVSVACNRVAFARARDMWLLLASFALIYLVFRTRAASENIRNLLWLIYGVSIAIALYALYQYFVVWSGMDQAVATAGAASEADLAALRYRLASRRVFSVFALPTTLSEFLALTFPLNVSLIFLHRDRPYRLLTIAIPLAANLWALFLSQSFTGFLSLVFCVGMYYLSGEQVLVALRRRWKTAAILGLFFLGAFVLLLYVRKMIFVDAIAENPLELRMVNWRIGLQAAADHPIIGVGPDNYQTIYTHYMRPGEHQARHAHSAPIEMLAETGLLGAAAFLLLLGGWLRRAWIMLRRQEEIGPERTAIAMACFALFFQNLLDIGIYFPSMGAISFMLIGLLDGPPDGAPRNIPLGRAWRVAAACACAAAAIAGVSAVSRYMSAEISYRTARDLRQAGEHEEALEAARDAIRLDPMSYEPYELLASVHLSRATPGSDAAYAARVTFSQALSLSPLTASLHYGMSLSASATGAPLLAALHARRAAELAPANPRYSENRERLFQVLSAAAQISASSGATP